MILTKPRPTRPSTSSALASHDAWFGDIDNLLPGNSETECLQSVMLLLLLDKDSDRGGVMSLLDQTTVNGLGQAPLQGTSMLAHLAKDSLSNCQSEQML